MPESSKSRSALSTAFSAPCSAWRNDRHRAGRDTLYTALHVALPGAVFRQQRQGLFVGFTQFRAIFHRVQVADRGEDTPQHIVHFRQRLAEIFPVYGAPCATTRSTFSRQSFNALVTAGTTCSGRILENGGNSKGVSNGFVIRAVPVKEVKEALNRRFT